MRHKQRLVLFLMITSIACLPPDTPGGGSQDKSRAVQAAKQDLAQKLGVKEQAIELVGPVEKVTWPDSSLGCPEPGMMYAQMLTRGYRFKLQSGGEIYEYHASEQSVKLCKP